MQYHTAITIDLTSWVNKETEWQMESPLMVQRMPRVGVLVRTCVDIMVHLILDNDCLHTWQDLQQLIILHLNQLITNYRYLLSMVRHLYHIFDGIFFCSYLLPFLTKFVLSPNFTALIINLKFSRVKGKLWINLVTKSVAKNKVQGNLTAVNIF